MSKLEKIQNEELKNVVGGCQTRTKTVTKYQVTCLRCDTPSLLSFYDNKELAEQRAKDGLSKCSNCKSTDKYVKEYTETVPV